MLETNLKTLNRMLVATAIGVMVAALGITTPANAQKQDKDKHNQEEKHKEKQEKGPKPDKHAAQQQQRAQRQQLKQEQQAAQQQQRTQRQQQQREQQAAQQQQRALQQQQAAQRQQEQRLAQQRQQLNRQQQQRLAQYRQQQQRQDLAWTQRSALLQQQRRTAQYRFQQGYMERRRQQILAQNARSYDYNNDPNFYTSANYRYTRGGRPYQTNQYGADLLRQAVNYGYQEGFQAGQADQQDGWRAASYQSSYAYQDANYGYTGYYVTQSEYSHYFREGFRRGYEDGHNSRSQYGSYSNGNYSILTAILSQILNLSSF